MASAKWHKYEYINIYALYQYLKNELNRRVCTLVLKSSTAILTWLKRREGPSADLIADLSQLESLTAEDELVVLGLFKVISFVVL